MISMVDNLWAEFDVWVERVLQLTEPLLEVTAQEDVCPNPAGNVTDDEGNYYALVGSSYRTIFETGRTLRNGHDDYAAKLTQLRSTLVNAQQVLVTYLEMLENQSAEDAAMYYSATGQPAQTAAFSAWQAFTVFDPAHHTGWIRPIFQFPQTFYTWAVESLSGLYGPEQKGYAYSLTLATLQCGLIMDRLEACQFSVPSSSCETAHWPLWDVSSPTTTSHPYSSTGTCASGT